MRRIVLLVAILFLLCGCSAGHDTDTIPVGIVEIPECTIVNNGRDVISGSSLSFEVKLKEGYALTGVDYQGRYRIRNEGESSWIDLEQVRYPTRLNLQISRTWCEMVFLPNGGEGEAVKLIRDLKYHSRPNTEPALFYRDGYTLVGWNSSPDGSGTKVGLGSRITAPSTGTVDLYAQWMKWSDETDFTYESGDTITITGYHGEQDTVVIPEQIEGKRITVIASGAFQNCGASHVILPGTVEIVEPGAFTDCDLEELTFFDNVESLPSDAFMGCDRLSTLHINAKEQPYGYHYRRESLLADKLDLLILNQGQRKIVFYGGCSMWYNLDGDRVQETFGENYRVINAAINGMINSAVQMQIITAYLEKGDVFVHTPEIGSDTQLMVEMGFTEDDGKLWCGLEYNYDLLTKVDLRKFPELLDSFQQWRERKKTGGSYDEYYLDSEGRSYFDPVTGSIPFERYDQMEELADTVDLNPARLGKENMARLESYYNAIAEKGVRIYLSHACINVDAMPAEQSGSVRYMDELFRKYTDKMESVAVVSYLGDYLYRNEDFYDTNYHLLSDVAQRNTAKWLRDLKQQMEKDGIWPY